MKPITQPLPTDHLHPQKLATTLTEVDRFVQQGCAEVSALAQLVLAWLESPEGCRQLEVVARALEAIRNSADSLAEYAGSEARAVNCDYEDPAELRRSDAARVAASEAAQGLGHGGAGDGALSGVDRVRGPRR